MSDFRDDRPPREPRAAEGAALESLLLFVQGLYFFLTGVWPLLHMDSFLVVTGPKTDLWLVRTVAVLVTIIGGTLLFAWHRRSRSAEIVLLAIASAAGLMLVDVVFSLSGVISIIYLLDAAAQALLIVLWGLALVLGSRRPGADARHLARQVFS